MKTLVIHPDDRSTDFLKPIYQNIPTIKVLTGGVSKKEVETLINEHDRIIMLGHGTPNGLLNINKFSATNGMYIIDKTMVEILRGKELISIWCYAYSFIKEQKLNGFCTDMFISEELEALSFLPKEQTEKTIEESNYYFSNMVGNGFKENKLLKEIYQFTKKNYLTFSKANEVADYNVKRLYYLK